MTKLDLQKQISNARENADRGESSRLQGNSVGAVIYFTRAIWALENTQKNFPDSDKNGNALLLWCYAHRGAARGVKGDIDNALDDLKKCVTTEQGTERSNLSWALAQAGETYSLDLHNTSFFMDDTTNAYDDFLLGVSRSWNAFDSSLKLQPQNTWTNVHCGALVIMATWFVSLHFERIGDRVGPTATDDVDDFDNPTYPQWLKDVLAKQTGGGDKVTLYFTRNGELRNDSVTYSDSRVDVESQNGLSATSLANTAIKANNYLFDGLNESTTTYSWAKAWQALLLSILSKSTSNNFDVVVDLIGSALIDNPIYRNQMLRSLLLIKYYESKNVSVLSDSNGEIAPVIVDLLNIVDSLLRIDPNHVVANYVHGKLMQKIHDNSAAPADKSQEEQEQEVHAQLVKFSQQSMYMSVCNLENSGCELLHFIEDLKQGLPEDLPIKGTRKSDGSKGLDGGRSLESSFIID